MSTSAIVLGGGHVPVLHSSHACFMSEEPTPQPNRRGLLGSIPFWFMTGGLAAGYGTCATMGGRYLFPEGGESVAWMFLGAVDDFEPGGSLDYKAPNGQKIAVARQGTSGGVEDFVALSIGRATTTGSSARATTARSTRTASASRVRRVTQASPCPNSRCACRTDCCSSRSPSQDSRPQIVRIACNRSNPRCRRARATTPVSETVLRTRARWPDEIPRRLDQRTDPDHRRPAS